MSKDDLLYQIDNDRLEKDFEYYNRINLLNIYRDERDNNRKRKYLIANRRESLCVNNKSLRLA